MVPKVCLDTVLREEFAKDRAPWCGSFVCDLAKWLKRMGHRSGLKRYNLRVLAAILFLQFFLNPEVKQSLGRDAMTPREVANSV